MSNTRVLFLSHGGGPLPLLADPAHQQMVDCLQSIANEISKPSAIVVISAHWEEPVATVTSGKMPSLIYDYGGFPEQSYHIKYPCPGEPQLAGLIQTQLEHHGIPCQLDAQRGFDHGMFVPLKIMYPEADIPCVQLSLLGSLDAEQHLNIGSALQNMDYDNLLIIGSGFSFHNMRAFFTPDSPESRMMNDAFEQWLIETCRSASLSLQQRRQRLIDWENAPAARFCHPREEHLLPLHVCCGVTGKPCVRVYELPILNKKASMYLW